MNSNSLSRSESGTSQTHYEDFTNAPSPKVLMDGYTQEGFDWSGPGSSPANKRRTGNAADPVTMHLLVETAVGDSSQFDVLSVEELDQLKKEEPAVLRRIASLRRELQLERRVRDTASALSRLSDGKSRGPATSNGRGFEGLSEDDYAVSARKCDEMSHELWDLERRHADLREKRLKHTAGILQMHYELQNGHSAFDKVNGWHDSDVWADGFNLDRVAPGGLADTPDGIMDIPGFPSQKTDTMLNELWRVLDPKASASNKSDRGLVSDGASGAHEGFSHEGFQESVMNLCTRAATLENQIKHEQETRSQNESNKSAERSQLISDLQDAHDQQLASQRKLQDAQADLMEARGELEQTKQEMSFIRQQHEYERAEDVRAEREAKQTSERELLAQLEASHLHISSLEQAHRDLEESHRSTRSQLQSQEATISSLQSSDSSSTARMGELQAHHDAAQDHIGELNAAVLAAEERAHHHEESADKNSKRMYDMEVEREDLEAEVVRLQTEVTVARAELDGAYGTRAQRAAEVADNPEIRKKLDELSQEKDVATKRIDVLQKELRDLVNEHESLVKQGVEAERDREALESHLDSLRDKAESLEVKLAEERLRKAGRRASGVSNGGSTPGNTPGRGEAAAEPTSMTIMRNEFKRMMRDARAEHFRGIRVSERRNTCLRRSLLVTNDLPRRSKTSVGNWRVPCATYGKSREIPPRLQPCRHRRWENRV